MPRRIVRSASSLALGALLLLAAGAPAGGPIRPDQVPELMAQARRADDRGQRAEADRLYRLVLEAEPDHDEAIRRLSALVAARPLSSDSEALRAARAALPEAFRRYESTRFVILSDAGAARSVAHAERLERAHHQLSRFAERLDLPLHPLRHKLVCVLFAARNDYQAFARRHDGVQDPWIAGYYAPATDRIVFYDAESNPSIVEARARLDEMHGEADSLVDAARNAERAGRRDEARDLRRHADRYREHLARERQRIDTFEAEVSVATAVHEAVHQLAFHTGLQSRQVRAPLWISEGLATAFETNDASAAFGPGRPQPSRRRVLRELVADDDLLPLAELVVVGELRGASDHEVERFYHQAWALFDWLCRHRTSGVRTYLDAVRREPPGTVDPDRALALFREAFGALATIERAWLADERAVAAAVPVDAD